MDTLLDSLLALCGLLADDGLGVVDQLTELSYLLLMRLSDMPAQAAQLFDDGNWDALRQGVAREGLDAYQLALIRMRDHATPLIGSVFDGAQTQLARAGTLKVLMTGIEGLMAKCPEPGQLAAGFTALIPAIARTKKGRGALPVPSPRHVEALVEAAAPKPDDVIVNPAVAFGELMIAASRTAAPGATAGRAPQRPRLFGLLPPSRARRLARANFAMHGLDAHWEKVELRDADSLAATRLDALPAPKLVLTQLADRGIPLSQELALLDRIGASLAPDGRAVVAVSGAVAGMSSAVRRLRTGWAREGFDVRYKPLTFEDGILLRLSRRKAPESEDQGFDTQPPARRTARPITPRSGDGLADVALADLLVDMRQGLPRRRCDDAPEVAVYSGRHLAASPDSLPFDRFPARNTSEDYLLRAGDLLVLRIGGRRQVARCRVLRDLPEAAVYFDDKLFRLRVDARRVLPEWVTAMLEGGILRQQIEAVATPGSGQFRLTARQLLGLRIPLPPLAEQRRIIAATSTR